MVDGNALLAWIYRVAFQLGVDSCHRDKSPRRQRASALRALPMSYRLCLDGFDFLDHVPNGSRRRELHHLYESCHSFLAGKVSKLSIFAERGVL